MKTLYVGCALRGAPTEFVRAVEALKKELEGSFEVFHFIGLSSTATVREIYETDIGLATKADIMLAICDQPSTGLGIEVAKRAELGLVTIVAHQKDIRPSGMVLGIAEVKPAFVTLTYKNLSDLPALLAPYQ